MAKYKNNILITTTDTGKRYYTSAIPSDDVKSSVTYQYTTRVGDRWDTIAYKYLGNAKYWYLIAQTNGGINGSIFIKPGTIITIPEVT